MLLITHSAFRRGEMDTAPDRPRAAPRRRQPASMPVRSAPVSCGCSWRRRDQRGGGPPTPWGAKDALDRAEVSPAGTGRGPAHRRRRWRRDAGRGALDAARPRRRPGGRPSTLTPTGPARMLRVVGDGNPVYVLCDMRRRPCSAGRPSTPRAARDAATAAPCVHPCDRRRVAKVFVAQGDTVAKGDRIAVVEAMKMEHVLTAPVRHGTVTESAPTGCRYGRAGRAGGRGDPIGVATDQQEN